MKNLIILHGTSGNSESFWIPYLKSEAEKMGYLVHTPNLPNTDDPDWQVDVEFLLNLNIINSETTIVTHSSGGSISLALLEKLNFKIEKIIMVAGYASLLPGILSSKSVKSNYDWGKIKQNVNEFIFINSDNDPWGANDEKGKEMLDKLGGMQITLHGEGHMGSQKFEQPYKEFPLLLRLI